MKRKMHYQVQPQDMVRPRSEQVQDEIQNFLEALDSYPARVAKEPGLSFHRYLCSFLTTARNVNDTNINKDRRDLRTRRQ